VGQHLVARQHAFDQRLDRAAGGLFAEQPGLDDTGVVEHQQVAGLQQRGQVAEGAVHRRGATAVEQARGAALGRRVLGDQLGRQGEVEIGDGEVGSAWAWSEARDRPVGVQRQNCSMADAEDPARRRKPPKPDKAGRPAAKLSGPAQAMRRLGLLRDIDLALHLPLRYEDETGLRRSAACATARRRRSRAWSPTAASSRGRRQLLVRLHDDSGELLLRFLHFYPSQQKQMAGGAAAGARRGARRLPGPRDGAPGGQAGGRRRAAAAR
jgi:hypothetical protein